MTDSLENQSQETLEASLKQVQTLLDKMRLVEELGHKQGGARHELVENLVHKQNLAELKNRLDGLHPADVAYILESLPLEDRLLVWEQVRADNDGEILLEVSDSVRESLIASMDNAELLAAAESLDTDEIADIAPDLPHDVIQELLTSLDAQKRAPIVAALAGVFIPLTLERFKRDPALGSSVLLTFITDSMGFFIFLGLATLVLL